MAYTFNASLHTRTHCRNTAAVSIADAAPVSYLSRCTPESRGRQNFGGEIPKCFSLAPQTQVSGLSERDTLQSRSRQNGQRQSLRHAISAKLSSPPQGGQASLYHSPFVLDSDRTVRRVGWSKGCGPHWPLLDRWRCFRLTVSIPCCISSC